MNWAWLDKLEDALDRVFLVPKKLLARIAWAQVYCSSCAGTGRGSWSDPWGCWDCQGMGWTPVRTWPWLSRQVDWTVLK